MKFPFRPRGGIGLALAFATLSVLAGGCHDDHVGRVCELNVPDAGTPMTGSNATINPQALECPSRVCVLPAKEKSTDTGPLCTTSCDTDEDCDGAEGGPKADTQDHRCESGFACVKATTVGEFACRSLCVCRDFLIIDPMTGYQKPPTCP